MVFLRLLEASKVDPDAALTTRHSQSFGCVLQNARQCDVMDLDFRQVW